MIKWNYKQSFLHLFQTLAIRKQYLPLPLPIDPGLQPSQSSTLVASHSCCGKAGWDIVQEWLLKILFWQIVLSLQIWNKKIKQSSKSLFSIRDKMLGSLRACCSSLEHSIDIRSTSILPVWLQPNSHSGQQCHLEFMWGYTVSWTTQWQALAAQMIQHKNLFVTVCNILIWFVPYFKPRCSEFH